MSNGANKWSRGESLIALVIAIATFVGTVFTPWYVHHETSKSERAALTSEAAYLCKAMAWQTFYLASNEESDGYRSPKPNQVNLPYISEDRLEFAWRRPSWFPFRTPVWTALKDKVGDFDDAEARSLTEFFNRVEFLDVLHDRRHCYSQLKKEFWHVYMCTIEHELETCNENHYQPAIPFEIIANEISSGLHCKQGGGFATAGASVPVPECDTDIEEGKYKH